MSGRRLLEWALRWFIGLIFIYAGAIKVLVPCEMAMDIYQYQLAPHALINIAAIILPSVEIILGVCLIVGIAPRGAALGLSLLLVFFIIALTINIIRGVDFDCGCFGPVEYDICHRLMENYQTNHRPDMDRITFVRLRTACDVIRDFIFLGASWGALVLMNRRMKRKRR